MVNNEVCSYLCQRKINEADIVTAKDVFQMATINGVKALGKSSEQEARIGKQGDMVIISNNSLHSVPLFDPLHLVYSCSKSMLNMFILLANNVLRMAQL